MMKQGVFNSKLFMNLSEGDCNIALSLLSAQRTKYSKNNVLVSAGDSLKRFGLVVSGTVRVSFTDIDGNDVLVANVTEGDTFGEALCWLNVNEIPVTVTALTDTEVMWLSPDILRENNSDRVACILKNNYLSLLASKTLSMNDRIQILSKPTLRQKLITFFSQCANNSGTKTFTLPFDRETMALYLGVNRSALSRELSKMEKEGIIEFYKNSFKIIK